MRLVQPTDFEILAQLADSHRNNAANLAVLLDQNRSYINTRLPVLADYGLVERVGPAEKSGLYVITERGHAAVACQEAYATNSNFEATIAGYLDNSVDHL